MTASSTGEFHELIGMLSRASTIEHVGAACGRFCRAFGFEHFFFGARVPAPPGGPENPVQRIVNGYPQEWWLRYLERNYLAIDPVVAHCATHSTPIRWEDLARLEKEVSLIRQFVGEAREFGLGSGVSLAVHAPNGELGCLSLAVALDHAQARERIEHALPYAQLFAAYLDEAARKIFDSQATHAAPSGAVRLTARERECLSWTAEGKTAWETSRILGISERTAVFHLQNASRKLGARNRLQALARAGALGLFDRAAAWRASGGAHGTE